MALDMNAALKISAGVSGQAQIDQLRGGLTRIKDQAESLNKGFMSLKAGLAGLAGALSLGAIANAVKQYADFADNMGKAAARAGVAAEELSKLSYAAKLSDVDMQTLSRGLRKLGEDAGSGGEKLRALGIELTDSSGKAKTSDQLFRDVADRFASMPDGINKTNLAIQLFGDRIGPQLIPLLNSGAQGLRDMGDEAERFGQVVDDEAAVAAAAFNDNLTRLQTAAQGLQFELGNRLIPTITRLSNELLVGIKYSDGFFDALRKFATINPFKTNAENLEAFTADLERLEARREQLLQGGGRVRGRSAQIQGIEREIEIAKARIGYLKELEQLANPPPRPDRPDGNGNEPDLNEEARRERERQQRILARQRELQRLADSRQRMIQGMEDDILRMTQGEDALTLANARRMGATEQEIAQIERLLAERNRIKAMDAELDQATRQSIQLRDEARRKDEELNRAAAQLYEQTRTPAERLNIEMARLNDLLQRGKIDWDTYSRAVFEAQDAFEGVKDNGKNAIDELKRAVEGWGRSATDAFVDFAFKGKTSFGDMVSSMLADLARMQIQKNVMGPIFDAFGGWMKGLLPFANGGIMTGKGSMPLPTRAYSRGGIANSPQLALFGEGSMPEAYVPLPDGRTIPVTLKGAGGGDTYHITVPVTVDGAQAQAMDGQGASALGKAIAGAVRAELINQKRPGGLLAA